MKLWRCLQLMLILNSCVSWSGIGGGGRGASGGWYWVRRTYGVGNGYFLLPSLGVSLGIKSNDDHESTRKRTTCVGILLTYYQVTGTAEEVLLLYRQAQPRVCFWSVSGLVGSVLESGSRSIGVGLGSIYPATPEPCPHHRVWPDNRRQSTARTLEDLS